MPLQKDPGPDVQLLQMLAEGRSQREIAKNMNVSSPELKKRLRTLYRTLLTDTPLIPKSPTTGTSQCRTVGLGLPCAKCRVYYAADLNICPNCKSPERVGYATEPHNLNAVVAVNVTKTLAAEVTPDARQPVAHCEAGSHRVSPEASRLASERVGYPPIVAVNLTKLLAQEVTPEIHQAIAHGEQQHTISPEVSRPADCPSGHMTTACAADVRGARMHGNPASVEPHMLRAGFLWAWRRVRDFSSLG